MVLSRACTYTDTHGNVHQSNSCFKRGDYLAPLSGSASIYYAVTNMQKAQLQKKDSLSQVLSQCELWISEKTVAAQKEKKIAKTIKKTHQKPSNHPARESLPSSLGSCINKSIY